MFCATTLLEDPFEACHGAPCALLPVLVFVKPGARVGLAEYDPVCTGAGATVKPQKASNSAGV